MPARRIVNRTLKPLLLLAALVAGTALAGAGDYGVSSPRASAPGSTTLQPAPGH